MNSIYKYPIKITDEQEILMAPGKIVHVGLDPKGTPCLWVLVWTTMPDVLRTIFVVGTGNPIPGPAKRHLGSFVQGPFVWHVFTHEEREAN